MRPLDQNGSTSATAITLPPAATTAVTRVLPAASPEPDKLPWLGAVLLDRNRVVAVDRYRFAVAEVDVDLPRLLLPAGPLGQAIQAAAERSVELCVVHASATAAAADGSRCGLVALPTDRYPPIDQVLSGLRSETSIEVETDALRAALPSFVRALAPPRRIAQPLVLQPSPDGVTLLAEPLQPETLPARCSGDEPVAVNPRYLRDLLAGVTSATVCLHVGGGLRPLWTRDNGWLHVLWPCQLPSTAKAAAT